MVANHKPAISQLAAAQRRRGGGSASIYLAAARQHLAASNMKMANQ